MSPFSIAIIGAGPVGTTLARLLTLHHPSIQVTVFEADASPNYRGQGGTLDLHTATGLAALQEAQLMEEFLKHARYDGESLKITDKDLKVYVHLKASQAADQQGDHIGGQRPEIDRAELRQLLVESLPDGVIRWGHRLKAIRPAEDGAPRGNELVFALGPTKEEVLSGFDLVVGADGAWSKIRPLLSATTPFFSGIAHHALSIPDAEVCVPEVWKFVDKGSVFVHVDGHKVSLQQMGDGSVSVGVAYRVEDEGWLMDRARSGFDASELEEVKVALGARLKDWHALVREAVARATSTAPRNLFMLPVGFSWTHRPGFTLVGDAAHVMTPYAGEGVNVGMEDARRLAKAVGAAGEEDGARLDGEVVRFEEEMFVRAGRFAGLTEELLRIWFFTEDSPRAAVPRAMASHSRFHAPVVLKPLAGLTGYVYGLYRGLVAS